jgi:hypothetical protein
MTPTDYSKQDEMTYEEQENEAHARNAELFAKHKNIPSYSLWYPSDVPISREACETWWKDVLESA